MVEVAGFPQEDVAIDPMRKSWMLFLDDSSCRASGGLGMHLTGPNRRKHHYMATLAFKASNNEARHEALVAYCGRTYCGRRDRATKLEAKSDS